MPVRVPPAGSPLDLALVIDATARSSDRELLLGDAGAWGSHVEQLVSFAESLVPHFRDVRLAVVAFGDAPPARAKSVDLLPRYVLHPKAAELAFHSISPDELGEVLRRIPPTSGGDFVDALADALAACRKLRWRPEARKLLVVFGDSPGHSILHPGPQGSDARVRELDVDRQAWRLHAEEHVEIMTLFLEPGSEDWREIDFKRELVDFARKQYKRLATRREMACLVSGLEVSRASQAVLRPIGPLGREIRLEPTRRADRLNNGMKRDARKIR